MSRRDEIRQRVTNFLTPDQLKKWDAEIAKAKEFLGQNLAAKPPLGSARRRPTDIRRRRICQPGRAHI